MFSGSKNMSILNNPFPSFSKCIYISLPLIGVMNSLIFVKHLLGGVTEIENMVICHLH